MKGRLTRAQTTRSETISCKGQPARRRARERAADPELGLQHHERQEECVCVRLPQRNQAHLQTDRESVVVVSFSWSFVRLVFSLT